MGLWILLFFIWNIIMWRKSKEKFEKKREKSRWVEKAMDSAQRRRRSQGERAGPTRLVDSDPLLFVTSKVPGQSRRLNSLEWVNLSRWILQMIGPPPNPRLVPLFCHLSSDEPSYVTSDPSSSLKPPAVQFHTIQSSSPFLHPFLLPGLSHR